MRRSTGLGEAYISAFVSAPFYASKPTTPYSIPRSSLTQDAIILATYRGSYLIWSTNVRAAAKMNAEGRDGATLCRV